ncbi:MAG TPA: aquaporin Z [Polyangiaceae bacterium]|nr:aquaporin Z [Polyangiaceae bacterium]
MSLGKRTAAECLGTFWLVFGGCGSALFAATAPTLLNVGIGWLGVAFAFGLTVLTMVYALGPVSGGHFNPAVTLGLTVGGRFPRRELPHYVLAQVAGAIVAAALLFVIAEGRPGFDVREGFAANGYGAHSPGGYGMGACLLAEIVLSFGFVFVVLGATDERAPKGFAGVAIGLALTLAHLVGIPITNTSVNPARSTGQALFVGGWAIGQLWLFWVAPFVGGVLAGLAYPMFTGARRRAAEPPAPERQVRASPSNVPPARVPTPG